MTIEWGDSLVFKDDFDNNGFRFTAALISLLNGPDGPKLVATKGDSFRDSGQPLFYAQPDITKDGLKLLVMNQIPIKEGSVPIYSSAVYLDEYIEEFIEITNHPTVSLQGFSEYPNTTTSGNKDGKIKVTETLSNGQEVEYEYTIPITVTENAPIGNDLIYRQNDGISQNILDNVKNYQRESQNISEKRLTINLTSCWPNDTGILLKIQ
ncbi:MULTISPECIES: hypothetical protein [Enterococcus]|uniref:hypothetical protein n=1 Tax=Enterococcus TaxID=1350 RepID=UPI0011EA6451|nr:MULTISPECIES: hypothetical protein [Enterococcus]